MIRAFSPRFLGKLPPMAPAALAQHIHGKVGSCGAAHPQSIEGEAPHQLTLLNLHPAQE
ncbi:MAG TPA: hypothetical protein VFA20_08565 [Myxococcaceae bacterium]|nr:hypothetical protein [Myxococcaceae bacterium]